MSVACVCCSMISSRDGHSIKTEFKHSRIGDSRTREHSSLVPTEHFIEIEALERGCVVLLPIGIPFVEGTIPREYRHVKRQAPPTAGDVAVGSNGISGINSVRTVA